MIARCWPARVRVAGRGRRPAMPGGSLAKPSRGRARAARQAGQRRKAMEDELARSMKDLHMGDDEPRPYFIAYTVSDLDQATISATLGATTAAHAYRARAAAHGDPRRRRELRQQQLRGRRAGRDDPDGGRLRGAAP